MKTNNNISIINKKASFEFEFVAKLVAGIQLQGTEIKSIRESKVNLSDAYCRVEQNELFVYNIHISEYTHGSYNNHKPKRKRKLLLKKDEIRKWHNRVKEKGFSIIPYKVFINDRGLAKVEVALARGKKIHDKRASIKEKDNKRQMDRILKSR